MNFYNLHNVTLRHVSVVGCWLLMTMRNCVVWLTARRRLQEEAERAAEGNGRGQTEGCWQRTNWCV